MTTPRFAKLATDLLSEEQAPRAPSSEAESRALAAIEDALARRRRSRRIVQVASALAIAAAVGVAFAGWSSRPEASRVATPAVPLGDTPSAAPAPVAPTAVATKSLEPAEGDRIEASPKGGTGIALADGSQVHIQPGSEMVVKTLSATRRFLLTRGSFHADVAKLRVGERFIVETEDAEVEVHGTSFLVAIREPTEGCTSHTRVEVTEGIVSVRANGHEDRVGPGGSWPACAAAKVVTSAVPRVPGPSLVPAPPIPVTPSSSPVSPISPGASSASASSVLAAQNALFAKGTAARRAGDGPGAVAAYDRLLAEYPDGFLAESASVERMRVLDGMDHARGREAASAYLARYPNGFARAEALRIAQ